MNSSQDSDIKISSIEIKYPNQSIKKPSKSLNLTCFSNCYSMCVKNSTNPLYSHI